MSHFYWGPRPPPVDVSLDWPELVPVTSGEIYGDWDDISDGLDTTLFPAPKPAERPRLLAEMPQGIDRNGMPHCLSPSLVSC